MLPSTDLPEDIFDKDEESEESGSPDNEEITGDDDGDVTPEEQELLEEASTTDPTYTEELRMRGGKVDATDDDGDPLNEGDDLDVPGSEQDDAAEEEGAEDEENNEYSLDKND